MDNCIIFLSFFWEDNASCYWPSFEILRVHVCMIASRLVLDLWMCSWQPHWKGKNVYWLHSLLDADSALIVLCSIRISPQISGPFYPAVWSINECICWVQTYCLDSSSGVFPLYIQPRSLNNQDHMNLYCFQHSTGGLWGCNFVAEMNCKEANFRSSILVYFKESLHMLT